MTAAERMKFGRLRRDGVITDETTSSEIEKLLRTFQRSGPKRQTPKYSEAERKRIKRSTGKTITQLREENDAE